MKRLCSTQKGKKMTKQHKPRDPFFVEMLKKKKGAHKSKKTYTRKSKHKGKGYAE